MKEIGSSGKVNSHPFDVRRIVRMLGMCLIVAVAFLSPVSSNPVLQHNGKVEHEPRKSFRNYEVWRTQPIRSKKEITTLMMFDGLEDISFWQYPAMNASADIMVSPEMSHLVKETLQKMGLKHTRIIGDLGQLVEQQNDVNFTEKQAGSMNWNKYYRYDGIVQYIKQQALRDDFVSYESIGTSSEGRAIILVKIASGRESKPAVFIDGGAHGREWLSPATVTYIMDKLITDADYSDLVEMFDWYIVPVVNVDGYEYTHTTNRMWRKTRSYNYDSQCIGTDPNRNWAFRWGGAGTSSNPCSDIYRGSRPFSEPETAAVAAAILQRRNQIKMYLTFHSYSQLWLLPWSHTSEKPKDYSELYQMAQVGAKGITSVFGTRYKVGSAPDLLYKAFGGSDDWAKGSAGIKYSYTLELRDTGRYGFAVPASQIQATGEETLRGVAAIARALHKTIDRKSG